jgi:hypothetical protein
MRRALGAWLAWCGLTAALLQAAPARPLYEPPAPPPPPLELRGTTWKAFLFGGYVHLTFAPDGRLDYRDGNERSSGTWRLTGNALYFQINGYSEYEGTVLGNAAQGHSWNKSNQRAPFHMNRVLMDGR